MFKLFPDLFVFEGTMVEENDEKAFYESDSEDKKEQTPAKAYVMDPDHRLLLRNTKPLLQSRNTAVSEPDRQKYLPSRVANLKKKKKINVVSAGLYHPGVSRSLLPCSSGRKNVPKWKCWLKCGMLCFYLRQRSDILHLHTSLKHFHPARNDRHASAGYLQLGWKITRRLTSRVSSLSPRGGL